MAGRQAGRHARQPTTSRQLTTTLPPLRTPSFPPPPTRADPGESVTRRVLREFAALHHELTEGAGVKVNLFQHSLEHGTPDAVFPNNWFSTHAGGEGGGGVSEDTLVFYPMKCPNRWVWGWV